MSKCFSWAATSPTSQMAPYTFERREIQPNDVSVKIDYCGVCHSDIHTARNEWPSTPYPIVPGHEIVGRVTEVGSDVTKFAVGDLVGVGCLVDSCRTCPECLAGLEQCCRTNPVWTYGSEDAYGEITQGGYSDHIVVREEFVLRFPESLNAAAAAPLLCAGITTYSPLRQHNVGPGTKVGIAGFGGLGAMGTKLAKALGAEVTVISRTGEKAEAARRAGADHYVSLDNKDALKQAERSLEVIVSTIPKSHDVEPYLKLLGLDGFYVIVGAIEPMKQAYHSGLVIGRRARITGSGIGSIRETQELLDFCAEKEIVSDVEVISIDKINDAYDKVAKGEIDHRYVIDNSTIVTA